MAAVEVSGFTHDRFAILRDLLSFQLAAPGELGASFVATVEGETVVDLWGGYADKARTRPWEKDTIVNVFSTTKSITAVTALLLADRGALDFDAPVTRYWPEFGANGKAGVKVRHLLSHTAGLPGWEKPISNEDLYDWEKCTSLLAAQAPSYVPGAANAYHGLTQGYLVGEVVRRITGRSLGTVFREEIAQPLDADFHIGLPASEERRVAELAPLPVSAAGLGFVNALAANFFSNPGSVLVDLNIAHTRAWRAAEVPAAGGHGNARSIADVLTILANGGLAKGKRFMSEAGCRKMLEVQYDGTDIALGMLTRQGMGMGVPNAGPLLPSANMAWGGGYGGSLVLIDFDARATYAYAMNTMRGGVLRGMALAMTMCQILQNGAFAEPSSQDVAHGALGR
jgi:CubicO group peptidase (beta-lactamase class C family)